MNAYETELPPQAALPYAFEETEEPESSGLSLAQLRCMLAAHPRASMIIAAVVVLLTVVLLAVLPRTYTATTMLMVNYQVNDPVNGRELPIGQLSSYIATQSELMHTHDVLLEVVKRLNLTSVRSYALGYTSGEGSLAEWVASRIEKKLEIHPSQTGSQLIYITFSASSAELAAAVPNTIAEIYRSQERVRESGAPGERAKRTDAELDKLKSRVEAARAALDEFERKNGMIADGGKSDADATTLENLESRLLEAQNSRRMAELRQSGDAASSDQALGSPLLQNTRSQLAAKEAQLAQMSRTYGQAYPGLREVQQQVDDLRATLAQVSQSFASSANSSVNAARELEARLARDVAAQRARIGGQGQLRSAEGRLRLEFESAQEAYKHALDSQGATTSAVAGKSQNNIDVVSSATPPLAATSPKVLLIGLAGLLAAVALGLGLPLVYELLNRRIRCKDDLERGYHIPVLAEFRLPGKDAAP